MTKPTPAAVWTLNTGQLEAGMFVRRPGLDESLEVVQVRNKQAKIKLPDGKTSTIPASAEVEWSRPGKETTATARKTDPKPSKPAATKQANPEIYPDTEWLTDWSLLSPGVKIRVLGEPGDFTVLRKQDSSARIKHDATGQIQPLSIGHKFMLIEPINQPAGKAAITTNATSPAKTKAPRKTRGDKGSKAGFVDIPNEDEEEELIAETVLKPADDEPTDEALAAIENGDDDETEIDTDDTADLTLDPESLEDLEDEDEDEDEDNEYTIDTDDTDNDPDDEENDMPKPQPKPRTSSTRSTSLLTVKAISERTGISYPTLMRYIRDHGDRLPSEGEGRARRFLPEAIEVFKAIRAETKGGRPAGSGAEAAGSGSKSAKPRQPKSPSSTPPRVERSHETAAPYAAPARAQAKAAAHAIGTRSQSAPAPSSTIDQALSSAIDHARAQIEGLQSLVENLEAQRESLKLWS